MGAGAALLGTVALVAFAMNPLERLIYFPDPQVSSPPTGVQERWIETEDGVRLHAWRAAAADRPTARKQGERRDVGKPAQAPVLVWSHGNGGNIAWRAEVLVELAARGIGVLAYDYRGYGRSEGRPDEHGLYLDAQGAYDSLRADGVPASRIVCFGESLGGAVSIELARRRRCAGVVVVSTFTGIRDVARSHYGVLAYLVGSPFDALARVGELEVPLLVAHGDQDEIVPFELGERLYAAAPEPKRFLRVTGAHHNDVLASEDLLDAIADFSREVTRPQ